MLSPLYHVLHRTDTSEAYKKAKEAGEKPPSVRFFSLGKRFTALRRTVEWLPEYSFGVVRYILSLDTH